MRAIAGKVLFGGLLCARVQCTSSVLSQWVRLLLSGIRLPGVGVEPADKGLSAFNCQFGMGGHDESGWTIPQMPAVHEGWFWQGMLAGIEVVDSTAWRSRGKS